MPGTSRQSGREAGSALLSLHQEDQENVNPGKLAPAQQTRAQAVLKAGNVRVPAPQQRVKTRRVAPLKDFPVNDEHAAAVPSWKAVSKQPAFTIHVDEAEETQQRPAELKEAECEDVLAFNAAVSLPGARKPLTPLDYPMDNSFVMTMFYLHACHSLCSFHTLYFPHSPLLFLYLLIL